MEKQIRGALIITYSGLTASVLYDGFSTPLSGTYFFDAYILAVIIAFVCSASATISLIYSRVPLVTRLPHFHISTYCLFCSITSLVAALALGLYLVLAPFAHMTATVICPVAFLVCSMWRTEAESSGGISAATKQLARMARKAFLVFSCVVVISVRTLAAYWPLVIIFGWAALPTKYGGK